MKPSTNTIIKRNAREDFELGSRDPVAFAWNWLGIDLHAGQEKFLHESTKPGIKESNLSAGNRYGKGEQAAVKILWSAFYQKRQEKFSYDAQGRLRPYIAINVSISLDQASIVFNKAAGYAQNSKKFNRFIDHINGSPFPTIVLKPIPGLSNKGAEIWARSTSHGAKYLLGQSFQYLNFDEASLEPNGDTILNDVIRMRMADSGGNIDTTSQPRGKNWFFHHFMKGLPDLESRDPSCYSQYGSSFDNPYIDHDYIKRSMEHMTNAQIEENIWGHFSDIHNFFPADQVMACYKDADYELPVPPRKDVVWTTRNNYTYSEFKDSVGDPVYVMGVDLAAKQDQTCIVVLRIDQNPWKMVYFELMGKTDWRLVKQRVAKVHKDYNAWGLVDSTGAGGPIIDDLIGQDFNCDLEGYNFGGTGGNKLTLLYELQLAIQNKELIFPYNKELIDSLTYYQIEDRKLFTDPVFGLALAVKSARDSVERSKLPQIFSADIPAVIARKDPATGMYIFSSPSETDELDQLLHRKWKHLQYLI